MENKFNVLDPVLVYATIDSINARGDRLVYSLKLIDSEGNPIYIDFVDEGSIQTVF